MNVSFILKFVFLCEIDYKLKVEVIKVGFFEVSR